MSKETIALIYFALAIGLMIWGFGSLIAALIRYVKEKPSDFASGIELSMKTHPTQWEYDAAENFIISESAQLEISIQSGNWGRVNTRQRLNGGSTHICNLRGKDGSALGRGIVAWRAATAIERQRRVQQWKTDALATMKAA